MQLEEVWIFRHFKSGQRESLALTNEVGNGYAAARKACNNNPSINLQKAWKTIHCLLMMSTEMDLSGFISREDYVVRKSAKFLTEAVVESTEDIVGHSTEATEPASPPSETEQSEVLESDVSKPQEQPKEHKLRERKSKAK